METRLCEHVNYSTLCAAAPATRAIWLWLILRRDKTGIIDASSIRIPDIVHVTQPEAAEAFEWLKTHSYWGTGDVAEGFPPILQMSRDFRLEGRHEGFKIQPWECRCIPPEIVRVPVPAALRAEVLAIGVCALCRKTESLEVDHIRPVSKGGTNDRSNLQALCPSCNRSKRDKWEEPE